VLSASTRPGDLFQLIQRHKVTHLKVVPALLIRLINDPSIDQYDLSSLRVIQSGGQRMQPEVRLRTRELIPGDPAGQAAAWGFCTTAFALGQAIAGYGFSFIFAHSENAYPILFLLGAAALLLALIVDFVAGYLPRARAASGRSVG